MDRLHIHTFVYWFPQHFCSWSTSVSHDIVYIDYSKNAADSSFWISHGESWPLPMAFGGFISHDYLMV